VLGARALLLKETKHERITPQNEQRLAVGGGLYYCRGRNQKAYHSNKPTNSMTKSTITELLLRVCQWSVVAFAVFTLLIVIGEERERSIWQSTPSTRQFYSTQEVCAVSGHNHKNHDPMTYSSMEELRSAVKQHDKDDTSTSRESSDTRAASLPHPGERKVLNCGHCGACSNVKDIAIYHHTRNTLTEQMTNCAKRGFFSHNRNYSLAFECLKEDVGMTDDCSWCWVDNAVCNLEHCVISCLKHKILPSFFQSLNLPSYLSLSDAHPMDTAKLDPCLACDERMCGPEFIRCSGANRRRTGVVSDISRDEQAEICREVDMDWILKQAVSASSSTIRMGSQISANQHTTEATKVEL
jgi:hypothetical protein